MTTASFVHRKNGFSIVESLIVIAVITILLGIMSQGVIWMKYKAEETSLLGRAAHFGTALQLYYQQHKTFPTAYPAHLEQDLAAYIDDADMFVSPADPAAGTEPLNRSYVAPVGNDGDRYVLSIDSAYREDRSVVLYCDGTAESVTKLPVVHNGEQVQTGQVVTGGSLTFGSSTIGLSGNTTATVVQSFVAGDGTPFHVLKEQAGQPAVFTAVAVGSDVIEVAAAPALVFVRGGAADLEVIPGTGPGEVKVSARSGEVLVDGKVLGRGELPDQGSGDNSRPFTVDSDHNIVTTDNCVATVKVLGKAITYGAGGPDCAVQAGAKFGDAAWTWLFNSALVVGGEQYSQEVATGTRIAVQGRASYGSWSAQYKSTVDQAQVLVLVNGDSPPQFTPFDGQPQITEFCRSVIDATTGKITIGDDQAVFLFELGTTNMQSAAADFQDLVLLVDVARVGASGGSSNTQNPGQALTGQVNLNPSNNSDFEFMLQKPNGSTITRDDLLASNRQLEYTGPATTVRFKPKGNGNQNSITLGGTTYGLQNGRVYVVTATTMTLHLYNDKKNSNGNSMGHWWLEAMSATDAHVTEDGQQLGGNADNNSSGGSSGDSVDDTPQTDYTGSAVGGSAAGSLGRGTSVRQGTWVTATKYH